MSPLSVTVEQYVLSVDAAETIRAVLDTTDTRGGDRLAAALRLAASAWPVYATTLNDLVANHGRNPQPTDGTPQPEVSAATVDAALAELARAAMVRVHRLWTETATEAYLSEGRRLSLVHVPSRFTLVRTERRPDLPAAWDGWRIAERTRPVPAGWYVIGEVGDLGTDLVGIGKLDPAIADDHADAGELAERLAGALAETDGFSASRCEAGCHACHATWYAEGGSWHFTPDDDADAAAWDYDDATGFRNDGTITCPACGTGRVGFMVI